MEFNDSLQQFVDLMKLITQATQINVYSKELVQIYNDARGKRIVALTNEQNETIRSKLEKFGEEVQAKQRQPESGVDNNS